MPSPLAPETLNAYAWLKAHVNLVGDSMPNRDGEIHLDAVRTKYDIWKEYFLLRKDEGFAPLNHDAFLRMWIDCLPYVTLRKYKVCV